MEPGTLLVASLCAFSAKAETVRLEWVERMAPVGVISASPWPVGGINLSYNTRWRVVVQEFDRKRHFFTIVENYPPGYRLGAVFPLFAGPCHKIG